MIKVKEGQKKFFIEINWHLIWIYGIYLSCSLKIFIRSNKLQIGRNKTVYFLVCFVLVIRGDDSSYTNGS